MIVLNFQDNKVFRFCFIAIFEIERIEIDNVTLLKHFSEILEIRRKSPFFFHRG